MQAHNLLMPQQKNRFQREVRRARSASAWILLAGSASQECHVLDISASGAKVIAQIPSLVPARFELAFTRSDSKPRACNVIWRRGKMVGVQFI
jgi:PilZ domain